MKRPAKDTSTSSLWSDDFEDDEPAAPDQPKASRVDAEHVSVRTAAELEPHVAAPVPRWHHAARRPNADGIRRGPVGGTGKHVFWVDHGVGPWAVYALSELQTKGTA